MVQIHASILRGNILFQIEWIWKEASKDGLVKVKGLQQVVMELDFAKFVKEEYTPNLSLFLYWTRPKFVEDKFFHLNKV